MKWSELSARERDALVAERVMGWTYRPINPDKPWLPAAVFDNKRGRGWYLDGPEELQLPHFSTEIAAAWEVAERMRGSLLEIRALRAVDRDDWEGFEVTIGKDRVVGKTLPEALCWAALRACGVEIE